MSHFNSDVGYEPGGSMLHRLCVGMCEVPQEDGGPSELASEPDCTS
jgi:hypothetical protein